MKRKERLIDKSWLLDQNAKNLKTKDQRSEAIGRILKPMHEIKSPPCQTNVASDKSSSNHCNAGKVNLLANTHNDKERGKSGEEPKKNSPLKCRTKSPSPTVEHPRFASSQFVHCPSLLPVRRFAVKIKNELACKAFL